MFIREFPSSAEFSVSIIKDQEKLQTVLITDPEIIVGQVSVRREPGTYMRMCDSIAKAIFIKILLAPNP